METKPIEPKKKESKVIKAIGTIVAIVLMVFAGGIGKQCGRAIVAHTSLGKPQSLSEALTEAAKSLNDDCPIIADDMTTVFKVSYDGNTFCYHNRLDLTYLIEGMTLSDLETLTEEYLQNAAPKLEIYKYIKEANSQLEYAYYDTNNNHLFTIFIDDSLSDL